LSPKRTEAFSDGVFAVAITLLVFNLAMQGVPAHLATALRDHWPAYVAYAVSFLTIGIIWVNHHQFVDHLHRVDRPLLYLNLVFLMWVAAIPFPTGLLADYLQAGHDQSVAAAVYGIDMTLMGASFGIMWLYAAGPGRLLTVANRAALRSFLLRFTAGAPVYGVAILVAIVDARVSLALYALLAIYYAAFIRAPEEARPGRSG
jgi:uncharacterized membrane protein